MAQSSTQPGTESRADFRSARNRAFTMLEVLLVLALIGLLATALVGGAASLLNDKPQTPEEVFWAAVQEARKMALTAEGDVSFRFVDDKENGKSFVATGPRGSKSFPVPMAGDLEVSFLTQQKGGTQIMIAGTVVETQKVEAVMFYPDGTCSPFRVQFFRNGGTNVMGIDPWTCAQVLAPADAAAGGARP